MRISDWSSDVCSSDLRELAQSTARDDYEALLDAVRRRVAERRFALGVHIVEGLFDPLEIAAGHSRLAEASILALAQAATAEFEAVHGKINGGRLRSEEHTSDLPSLMRFSYAVLCLRK